MGSMRTNVSPLRPDRDAAEQLTLLPKAEIATRFRLSEDTRRRGLRHVAEIREMLAERLEHSGDQRLRSLPPRNSQAA
jgi:hypothetical protein